MFKTVQKLLLFLSVLMLIALVYEGGYHNSAKAWKSFTKPQLAAYTSLEQDEAILKELDRQSQYNSYKPLNASFFVKPNIFQRIDPN